MAMEWWCEPIQDWNELQRLLDEHPCGGQPWREATGVWSKCDINPDPEFAPDTFYASGIYALVDRAKDIASHCPDAMGDSWRRLFFAASWSGAKWPDWRDYSNDYLVSARDLRIPKDLPDSHAFYHLCAALSPATVARLAQWSRELPLEDYEPYFQMVDALNAERSRLNRYANEWNSYAAYVGFWFEILQNVDKCGCGLLTFVA